jgi:hypothetical protein
MPGGAACDLRFGRCPPHVLYKDTSNGRELEILGHFYVL